MNKEFGRTITYLRKKKGVSQKDACAELGISQALLSHYEKGIRECGLSFLIKLADYYEVSVDYLLGRSQSADGRDEEENTDDVRTLDDINRRKTNTYCMLNRKLQINTTAVIYSILSEINNKKLTRSVSEYLSVTQYYIFRKLFENNPKSSGLFDITDVDVRSYCKAQTALSEARMSDVLKLLDTPELSDNILSDKFDESYPSLHQLLKNAEKAMNQSFKI
ncbi:MAG: helix-turn-helix transcriptional regulator [Ruminococcus sp.]|nr:helix-turn-helix transcriptional regulator [Ruminococcus sp.]